LTYHCGRRFTVGQKACQGRKKEKEKGRQVQFSICSVLWGPSGSMLEIEPAPIGDFIVASFLLKTYPSFNVEHRAYDKP